MDRIIICNAKTVDSDELGVIVNDGRMKRRIRHDQINDLISDEVSGDGRKLRFNYFAGDIFCLYVSNEIYSKYITPMFNGTRKA